MSALTAREICACRACGRGDLSMLLDLGSMPLVNALSGDQAGARSAARFPLALVHCAGCSLVQLSHDVPPQALFSDYSYFSSYSETMLRHVERLVGELCEQRRLETRNLVIEIASNDGYLLQFYKARGIPVLGIEPARNVADVAIRERGIPTRVEFFDEALGARLAEEGSAADVLHAHNTLAHTPDPLGFLRGMAAALAPGGLVCIEVPHVVPLVESAAFDTIYHEHYSYFSLTALDHLAASAGLTIVRVEQQAIHGGSLRVFAQRSDGRPSVDESVSAMLRQERGWGIGNPASYRSLSERAERTKNGLRGFVEGARRFKRPIAAYGASAKGCVALNFAEIDSDDIVFVADRNPHKQGRFVPGTGLPVSSPVRLLQDMPALTLLTTWNLRDEVLAQESEYRRRGGRFVVPIPQLEVLP